MSTVKITEGLYLRNERETLHHVDATPDAGYVLRILRAHLDANEATTCTDNTAGSAPTDPICVAMNVASAERARLLRAAIRRLGGVA